MLTQVMQVLVGVRWLRTPTTGSSHGWMVLTTPPSQVEASSQPGSSLAMIFPSSTAVITSFLPVFFLAPHLMIIIELNTIKIIINALTVIHQSIEWVSKSSFMVWIKFVLSMFNLLRYGKDILFSCPKNVIATVLGGWASNLVMFGLVLKTVLFILIFSVNTNKMVPFKK